MKRLIYLLFILFVVSCEKDSVPRVIILESLTIKKFPVTKSNGAGWDVLPSSGPDIYLILSDTRGTLFKQTSRFVDCTTSTVFAPIEFATPIRISDIKQTLTFQLWDYDSTTDEFMGALEGTIYDENTPTTLTVSSTDGQIVFDMKLSYEY